MLTIQIQKGNDQLIMLKSPINNLTFYLNKLIRLIPYRKTRKPRNENDFNSRLKILNKVLRGKLKELNDRLERVLDKVYVKSLNPTINQAEEPPIPHQIQVADKEIENAKKQYNH